MKVINISEVSEEGGFGEERFDNEQSISNRSKNA